MKLTWERSGWEFRGQERRVVQPGPFLGLSCPTSSTVNVWTLETATWSPQVQGAQSPGSRKRRERVGASLCLWPVSMQSCFLALRSRLSGHLLIKASLTSPFEVPSPTAWPSFTVFSALNHHLALACLGICHCAYRLSAGTPSA